MPLFVRAGSVIAEGGLLHADSPEKDDQRTLRVFPDFGLSHAQGSHYDDNGTENGDNFCLLHWRLATDNRDIHLHLTLEGRYHPAWQKNIRVELPAGERRRLQIHGELTVQTGE